MDGQVDDLKRHRYDVADVLRDVCRILGGVPCLRQVVFLLEQEVRLFFNLYTRIPAAYMRR